MTELESPQKVQPVFADQSHPLKRKDGGSHEVGEWGLCASVRPMCQVFPRV